MATLRHVFSTVIHSQITKLFSNFEVSDRKGIINWGTQMLMND